MFAQKSKSFVCFLFLSMLLALALAGCSTKSDSGEISSTSIEQSSSDNPSSSTVIPSSDSSPSSSSAVASSSSRAASSSSRVASSSSRAASSSSLIAPDESALFRGMTLATSLKNYNDGNPLMTQAFHADPYAISYGDRVYVYGSDDTPRMSGGNIQPNNYSGILNVALVSSGDLVNWTHHPLIRAAGRSGAASWSGLSWAPAVAYKQIGGQTKFFLYIANGTNGIGVLTSDSPTGPFTDPLGRALINRQTPGVNNVPGVPDVKWLFDPDVLIDDNGKAYIYFGGGIPSEDLPNHETLLSNFQSDEPMPGTFRVAELGPDMTSIVSGSVKPFPAPFLFEAASINKISGVYYFTYCSNFQVGRFAGRPQDFPDATKMDGGAIVYMTSDKPTEGFTLPSGSGKPATVLRAPREMFSGTALGNNHQSIVGFKGNWYIVYHSLLLRNYMNHPSTANGFEGYRSTHIDQVTINAASKTITRVNGSKTGAPQVGRFDPYQKVNAATMAVMAGISTVEYQPASGARAMKVSDINSGDWLALRGVDFGRNGANKFTCRVTPPSSGIGAIQIRAGGLNGTPVGYVRIEPGRSEYTVNLLQTVTNVQDIVFVFYGTGWDFEEWQFAGAN